MKRKTEERLQFWLIAIGLFSLVAILLFNAHKPKEFICLDDGRIVDAESAYTLREIFEDCTYECGSEDYVCLELCTDMISDIVNNIKNAGMTRVP